MSSKRLKVADSHNNPSSKFKFKIKRPQIPNFTKGSATDRKDAPEVDSKQQIRENIVQSYLANSLRANNSLELQKDEEAWEKRERKILEELENSQVPESSGSKNSKMLIEEILNSNPSSASKTHAESKRRSSEYIEHASRAISRPNFKELEKR